MAISLEEHSDSKDSRHSKRSRHNKHSIANTLHTITYLAAIFCDMLVSTG